MSQPVSTLPADRVPALVAASGDALRSRFVKFFDAPGRRFHTRRAYARAVCEFLAWCEGRGVVTLGGIEPPHVAAYLEAITQTRSIPTTKLHLAAIRSLFDWLVVGGVLEINPAASAIALKRSIRA